MESAEQKTGEKRVMDLLISPLVVGDVVVVLDGTFEGFSGPVASVRDADATVLLNLFGRETPYNVGTVSLEKLLDGVAR